MFTAVIFGRPAGKMLNKSPPFSFSLKGGDLSAVRAAGVPDITGSLDWTSASTSYTGMEVLGTNIAKSGALSSTKTRTAGGVANSNNLSGLIGNIVFSASMANPVYGKSNTVQQAAICNIPQVKI